jgi:hypothetical protein
MDKTRPGIPCRVRKEEKYGEDGRPVVISIQK